ncbi:MAG: PEP-utilizing enzyme [Aestuariivita sp.]|nr:PEP-utilizing enzyme [Aestuariivita sp.]
MQEYSQDLLFSADARVKTSTHGWRAELLQKLVRFECPVPKTLSLSFSTVEKIATDPEFCVASIIQCFDDKVLFCVRPSPENAAWGGPNAILGVGMTEAKYDRLKRECGVKVASRLFLRSIQSLASAVEGVDFDFMGLLEATDGVSEALKIFEDETTKPFPLDPSEQLVTIVRSMARAWNGTSARILREAKGAPEDAHLGLLIQEMIVGAESMMSGSGTIQLVDSDTGQRQVAVQYASEYEGEANRGLGVRSLTVSEDRERLLVDEISSESFSQLMSYAAVVRKELGEEIQLQFKLKDGEPYIIDGTRAPRSGRASVQIAVRLVEDGIITEKEAVMRVEPASLNELMHRQVAPSAVRDIICQGIGASPGAAVGRIVFTSAQAQMSAAREEACILVRRETSPDDIRGMHSAAAVLTERGGLTSHAAVIARGLGLPCIVGASSLEFCISEEKIITKDGREFRAGDVITIDGASGQVLAGESKMLEASADDAFTILMTWADSFRDIGIRANADTPDDAKTARKFNAQGIGLCRTEYMFFDPGRLTVMREMIFADTSNGRAEVLARLLPMQRDDFVQLFQIMQGSPVCIRLFDPPLHEFLPSSFSEQRELAQALEIPIDDVIQRVSELTEYNPMLGLRGVRLGVTIPEIYEMQARAIFEAALEVGHNGDFVIPEIMLPLVSAQREVELIKERVDAVYDAVQREQEQNFQYRLGVMVETPRAALRAGEIACLVEFLSFGTNDLTQMTYGLSRDDAGRFMSDYVQQGVFSEDPFRMLDRDGVGELLNLGAQRGRSAHPDITLSICGEHGGDPESIAFCRDGGFDYVSCSPFRVPLARLSAAQLAISQEREQLG